ncbi:MAG: PPOX class F420-dependent oxidoreductase [Chloroflexi bacterium]|nr:PPOX class F420-dependent oxidoreductase [Chloroflexota bacterium]
MIQPRNALSATARAFLDEPRMCVMATINRDGTPQLVVMWYEVVGGLVILNTTRGLVKERNLRRDPRMAVCVEDGMRYITLSGRAEILEDRALQETEVNRMARRYRGPEQGANHWQGIAHQDRLSIHMPIERIQGRGFD